MWYTKIMSHRKHFTCTVERCVREHEAGGYCQAHYVKYKKYGNPLAGKTFERHGMENSPEYSVWLNMKQRCYNPKNGAYMNYGGRGIIMCDEWKNSFSAFLKDMGTRPKRYTLDRIDNNKGYSLDNCRWATPAEQNVNQRIRKDNTSGYRGVLLDKSCTNKKWYPQLSVDGVIIKLPRYKTAQEAAYIRDQFAMQIYGSSAQLNFEYA